jgi:cardiolipin synthase A/B
MMKYIPNNQITLLCNGLEYFPALIEAIQQAKHEIYLQTYIYELDKVGVQVSNALIKAAKKGVYVRVLLDGFGCRDFEKAHMSLLIKSGVQVLFFRPKISPWTFKRGRLRRLHSKLVVIDGQVGFVGGINIVDDYNTPEHTPPRIDYAVKTQGPIVKAMYQSAHGLWHRVCRSQFKKINNIQYDNQSLTPVPGQMDAQFVVRDNFKHRRDIENAYLSAISSAKTEIIIANAYFLPGLRFRHALRDASARGVRIVLLLQNRTEYLLLDFATRALYTVLLKQGICIYEYHKSFMHSKVAVFDQQLAIVGSSNIDPFSLFLSLESNVVIKNKDFAEMLKQHLQKSIDEGAVLITVDDWQHHNRFKRFVSWITYGCVKLVLAVAGYPENI